MERKLRYTVLVGLFLITLYSWAQKPLQIEANQVPMVWWYDKPATKYWEGLPIGTGRFGAMIPGSVDHEIIAFNDETLWTGGPYNPNNTEGPEILRKVREQAFAHNWSAADKEAQKLFGNPPHVQFYQPMAQLNIQYNDHDPAEVVDYHRALNMDSALVQVSYMLEGVNYSREIFASYPNQVIVLRLTADQKGKINFSSWFSSLQPSAVTRIENDQIIMEGTTIAEKENEVILPPQMRWQSRLKVISDGGTLRVENGRVTVSNANAATLILAGATNWVAWNDVSGDEDKRCADYITDAAELSYEALLRRHLDDYCPTFAACRLDLGADPAPLQTTTDRMEAIRDGVIDPAYEARYFQYGRYLMLAAAREGTLAFNNHNLWLNDLDGRWRGRWTLNINLQECYWPVESTNLPNINESLLLFTEQLAQAGARTARELYGCDGWCAHHGVDIWFNTSPTDGQTYWGLYPMAGVWIMQQLYEHFKFNPDTTYLRRIYPLLKGSTEFLLDFMVTDPESGYLVTVPSTSPENSFLDEQGRSVGVSFGSAGDIQLARNQIRNFIEASTFLSTDPELRQKAIRALEKLPPHKIGRYGQLQEWFFDFKEAEPTHRHTSHLLAVYPDDDITLRKTPELAEAAKVVLQRRGDINMGWSGAWKINLLARLEESEEAYEILHKMLTDVSIHPRSEDSRISPSFEGNQGIQAVTSGIGEMLLQSHSGEIYLLPALPSAWKNGTVEGLRARGGFEVDLRWEEGSLSEAVINATQNGVCKLRAKTAVKISTGGIQVASSSNKDGVVEFQTKSGKAYLVESL